MQARKIILLIVAFMIAGVTVMVARSMLSAPAPTAATADYTPAPTATQVLVAARDLPSGTLLKDTDLKWQVWPADAAHDAYAIKGKVEITSFQGSVVRQSLRAGEPLLSSHVVRTNEQGFLAAVLTTGMRAITIPVTPASSIAGLVFPGDRIDLLVTHRIIRKSQDGNASTEHKVSETVVSNVRVLALDQRTNDQTKDSKDAGKPPQLATLEVAPEEARQVALASDMGILSLVLRPLAQETPEGKNAPDGFVWDSDLSRVMPGPVNRNGQVHRVQIMRGKDTTETLFDSKQ